MRNIVFTLCALLSLNIVAQNITEAKEVQESLIQKKQLQKKSIVKNINFNNIGPTVMSGRVADVDVNPDNPTEFYVGYASGGLWYTNNNGTTFTPVLDNSPTQNVGDIAIDWKSGTIWVGTGENNSSRSSYAGIGILKSTDHGKTWEHMGLEDSHHIGRILINPHNPNEVVVGVLGHLYSTNEQRGIYKTKDGGQSWEMTLNIANNTGIVDLAAAPENFDIMYAAAWEKDRKAWDFKGSGSHSGIYKSTDAGATWNLVSTQTSGFPTGDGAGRIGLAVYDAQTVYAVHDSQFHQPTSEDEKKEEGTLEKEDFKTMKFSTFLDLADGQLNKYLRSNGFPK